MTISRRNGLLLAAGTLAATVSTRPSQAQGNVRPGKITTAQFDAWIALRGGDDGRPGYWYSDGLVRSMFDGVVESRMLGVETWITPKELRTPTSAISLSRKVYFFLERDKDVAVLDKATGKPRAPSIYAYQLRTFTLIDGVIDYKVESHDTRATRVGGAGSVYTITGGSGQIHVNYAVFPTRPQTNGVRSGGGEVYDYFDHGPAIAEMPQRYQHTWAGANTAGSLSNMIGWRYPTFDAIPNEWLKVHIRKNGPMWVAPPKDMTEIETLRKTIPVKTGLIPA